MSGYDEGHSGERGPSRRRSAGRRYLTAIVAAVAAAAVGGVAGTGVAAMWDAQPGLSPDAERVSDVVEGVFAGGCVDAAAARADVTAALDTQGLEGWDVVIAGGVGDCVAAGVDPDARRVVLIPALRPDVAEVMGGVRRELMDRCLGKEEAIAFVASALRSLGVQDFSVATDGPVAGPVGGEQALREHLAADCFVYSGSGHDGDRWVFYVSGLDV